MPNDAPLPNADAHLDKKHAWMAAALGMDRSVFARPGADAPGGDAPGGIGGPSIAAGPIIPVETIERPAPPPLPVSALTPKAPDKPTDGRTAPGPAKPPPIIPYDPATIAAPAPAQPPPPAPLSAVASRADLERRIAKAGDVYDKYGKAIGDDAHVAADRLSAAEQKVGKVVSENEKEMVVTNRDGSRSTTRIALDGQDSHTVFDEKGFTTTSKQTHTTAGIGADGKVAELSKEHSESLNVGIGNVTKTVANKVTDSAEGKTVTTSDSTTKSADLLKGEAAVSRTDTTETREAGVTQKRAETVSATAGMSGVNVTAEVTRQTDKNFETRSTSAGLARGAGQLGLSTTDTKKTGTMGGTEEAPYVAKGTEDTSKKTVGLVSDDKGTGIGATTARTQKTNYGEGNSLSGNYSAGGKYQSIVKEVPNSDPPKFTITTTISFDVSVGRSGATELAPIKPVDAKKGADEKAGGDPLHKGSATIGVTAAIGGSASFKRVLEQNEAAAYIDSIKQNGRGSKLPEHQILASGLSEGWDKAAELWAAIGGSAAGMKELKPGEEIERASKRSLGVKGGVSGGERRTGGLSLGADAGASHSEFVSLKLVKQEKGLVQVTATVDVSDDTSWGVSAGYGQAAGSHGETHGKGKGQSVVFILDGNDDKTFNDQLDEIDSCGSIAELQSLAKNPAFKVSQSTEKDSSSDGVNDGISLAGKLNVGVMGKGAAANEVTRDKDGNVVGSKTTASNETGGSIGVGEDVKAAYSEVEGLAAEVGKDGQAKAELSTTVKQSSLGKTIDNLVNDPLGAVLNPAKAVAAKADMKGIDLNDAELMGLARLALDEGKWRGQVGGRRQDDWIAAGEKIRKAITVTDGAVTGYDKTAINRALGEWTKGTDGERISVLNNIVRPFKGRGGEDGGGALTGKGVAFPDGTDRFKPQWDSLMTNDVVGAAKGKLAADPKGALAELQAVLKQLEDLAFTLKDNSHLWQGALPQHAEMLGHINTRMQEAEKAIREAGKGAKHAARAAKHGGKADTAPNAFDQEEEAEEQEGHEVKDYHRNLETMQGFHDAVWNLLLKSEKKLDDKGLFSSDIDNIKESYPWIKEAGEQLGTWTKLYPETYRLWDKLHDGHGLDKAAMEKLHPKGAQERWDKVRAQSLKV